MVATVRASRVQPTLVEAPAIIPTTATPTGTATATATTLPSDWGMSSGKDRQPQGRGPEPQALYPNLALHRTPCIPTHCLKSCPPSPKPLQKSEHPALPHRELSDPERRALGAEIIRISSLYWVHYKGAMQAATPASQALLLGYTSLTDSDQII